MDLQEQLEVGKQAEDFLRYIEENPYFKGLLERIKLEMARQILDLQPQNTERFSDLKIRMDAMDEILNAARGDIYLGSEALKKLDGVKEPGGLL